MSIHNPFRDYGHYDYETIKRTGSIAKAGGYLALQGALGLAFVAPPAAAVLGGIGAGLVAGGSIAEHGESIARYFGAKGITDEDKFNYVARQAELANAANTQTGRVKPRLMHAPGVVNPHRLAKSLAAYQAKKKGHARASSKR